MSTAKVKLKNQEFEEAIKYLKTELKENPGNDEAKLLLADTYIAADMDEELIAHIQEIKGTIKDPKMVDRYNRLVSTVWTYAFNSGIMQYNKYLDTKSPLHLDSALTLFDAGVKIKPQMVDFHRFKGVVYELKGDTANAVNEYKMYVEKITSEIEFANKHGIFLNMSPEEVVSILGAPVTTKGIKQESGDSILVQFFNKTGEEIFYYQGKEAEPLKLYGWRTNLPDTWMQNEKLNSFKMDISPILNLAQYQYEHNKKDQALENIKLIANIDPSNEDINTFMVNLYLELDRTDEAINSIKELVQKDPNNEVYRTKFGDLYANLAIKGDDLPKAQKMEYFEKAVEQYEKALEADPNYDLALRNIASAYKNIAAIIQEEEMAKYDNDKSYELDVERYEPYLKKSADYFKKAIETDRYKDDYTALNDLANIHMVLGNDNDLRQVVRKMEALEYSVSGTQDKLTYYYKLLRIYGDLKEKEKMQATQKKIQELEK